MIRIIYKLQIKPIFLNLLYQKEKHTSDEKNILLQYFNTEINYYTYPPTYSLSLSISEDSQSEINWMKHSQQI